MSELQIFKLISSELNLTVKQVKTVTNFLDEGATVPFLARYRKEATQGLDEEQIRAVRDAVDKKRVLEQRRETILNSIESQGKLSGELKQTILEAKELKLLEDLYLPYKPKRQTRASKAKDAGLEPLADLIYKQDIMQGYISDIVEPYINPEKGITNQVEALAGAADIIAEWISENIEIRDLLRNHIRKFGKIVSKRSTSASERTVFETYYDFNCPVKYLKPYQILALNRGEREGVLTVSLHIDIERELEYIDDIVLKNEDHLFVDLLLDSGEDAFKRLLIPSLERELRNELTETSDQHAIDIFAKNLDSLLMQPPLKNKVIIGIDPAYRTGCKVAVIDQYGKYLEGTTIYPVPPHNEFIKSAKVVRDLIEKYKVELIAIGNGTGSRETEQFIADLIRSIKEENSDCVLNYIIVNEAGASVYSASPLAKKEFPNLEAAQRGNISIARRVQDPLAELVKIDPKSIGVGLYQHDVNQVYLMKSLDDVVESCVNTVGVNLNTASSALLNHVSGLTSRVATAIVEHRTQNGAFQDRNQLLDISGMGPFRFQQAAGFLRIPESKNPFDNTAIHPESYEAAKKLCGLLGIELRRLNQLSKQEQERLHSIDKKATTKTLGLGLPTLELIIENLLKPGRDPRESLPTPILRHDILKIDNLAIGQILEGTVRNVVDFGAFIDIGVKEDGLLHISQMSSDGNRVDNPLEVAAVGDIIKVKIDSIDKERGRIGLSMA